MKQKIETGKHIHALSGTFTHMHVRSSLLTNCDNSRNFCGYCLWASAPQKNGF